MLVGTSLNTAKREKNFSEDMAVMQSLYYNSYNLNEKPTIDMIIIATKDASLGDVKKSHREIKNLDKVHAILEKIYYPRYKVKLVQWDMYSLKDQLKMLARTKLLITLSESSSIQPVFMQDDAAIINFCSSIDDSNDWFFIANMKSRKHYTKYCGIQKDMEVDGRVQTVVDIQNLRKTVQTVMRGL